MLFFADKTVTKSLLSAMGLFVGSYSLQKKCSLLAWYVYSISNNMKKTLYKRIEKCYTVYTKHDLLEQILTK
jgi:hypothetical protein